LSVINAADNPMLAIKWPTTESKLARNALGFQLKATNIVFKNVVGALEGWLPLEKNNKKDNKDKDLPNS
jgi:hypothetical protein